MLTGCTPPEETGSPDGSGIPRWVSRSTEIWLLPASTASRNRPSGLSWIAPWDPRPAPSPAPPIGERRPGYRCQRPVGVPVESCDGVRACRVVVDVGVAHDRRCGGEVRRSAVPPTRLSAATRERPTPRGPRCFRISTPMLAGRIFNGPSDPGEFNRRPAFETMLRRTIHTSVRSSDAPGPVRRPIGTQRAWARPQARTQYRRGQPPVPARCSCMCRRRQFPSTWFEKSCYVKKCVIDLQEDPGERNSVPGSRIHIVNILLPFRWLLTPLVLGNPGSVTRTAGQISHRRSDQGHRCRHRLPQMMDLGSMATTQAHPGHLRRLTRRRA